MDVSRFQYSSLISNSTREAALSLRGVLTPALFEGVMSYMVWWLCTSWFITSLFGVLYLKTFEASWQGLDSEKKWCVDFVESAVDYGDRRLRERDWRAAKVTGACAPQISEHAQSLFILIYELLSFYRIGWCKRRTLITSPKGPLQVLTTGHFGILREFSGISASSKSKRVQRDGVQIVTAMGLKVLDLIKKTSV